MLRRLAQLPFAVAGRLARAYQAREDAAAAGSRDSSPGGGGSTPLRNASPGAARVGNGGEGFDVDPDSCRIDAHDALAWHRDGRAAFVDVRPVQGPGVPGATHLPVDEANMRVSELPTDVPVVAYCDDGADSARVVAFFRARGMEDTWWMAGGLPAWRDAGGAVTP